MALYFIIEMLREWIDPIKLDFNGLCHNPHFGAIELKKTIMENNTTNTAFKERVYFSANGVIESLRENSDKIYWDYLCKRTQLSDAITLLRENPDKIDWKLISKNRDEGAIELLRENPDKIDWFVFSGNPRIFYDDYSYVLK